MEAFGVPHTPVVQTPKVVCQPVTLPEQVDWATENIECVSTKSVYRATAFFRVGILPASYVNFKRKQSRGSSSSLWNSIHYAEQLRKRNRADRKRAAERQAATEFIRNNYICQHHFTYVVLVHSAMPLRAAEPKQRHCRLYLYRLLACTATARQKKHRNSCC